MRERCKMWDVPRTESDSALRSWKQALSYQYWNFISSFIRLNCISNHSLFNPTASKLVPCWLWFIIPLQTSLHFHTFPMWQVQKVTSSYRPGDHPQSSDCLSIPLLHQPLPCQVLQLLPDNQWEFTGPSTVNPPELLEWAKCLPLVYGPFGSHTVGKTFESHLPLKIFLQGKFSIFSLIFNWTAWTDQGDTIFLAFTQADKNCPNQ